MKTNCGRGGANCPTLSRIHYGTLLESMPRFALLVVSALISVVALACDKGARAPAEAGPKTPGGTIVLTAGGDPDVLFPPLLATITAHEITELVYDHLAEPGTGLNVVGDAGFEPRLAKSWQWSPDSLSIEFHLDPLARWHDGQPVRASDVAFTYSLYKDSATASPSAPLIAGIDSVTVPDSLTAVFWFGKRSPTQFYEAVSPMVILPEHALSVRGQAMRTSSLARAPMGSGRYRFVAWNAGSSVELRADTANYRGRPKTERLIWSIAPDFNTALTRVLGGEVDVLEQLTAADMDQLRGNSQLRTVLMPGMEYNFIQFNLRDPSNAAVPHPLFGDRNLRRALTMAVDRARTVKSVYDTLAAVALGPTVRAYPTTDTTLREIPYSVDAAGKLLDSIGWKVSEIDSIRRRNGRPLAFTLSVPGSSRNRMNMAVLIQNQLRKIGVHMNIDRLEFAAFVDHERGRDFDAVMGSWQVDASPVGIRQTWGSPGANKSGSNYGSYTNPSFDIAVDSALATIDPAQRRERFTRAYQTIIDDAPGIWLAEPRSMMAVSRRIRVPALRPDAWWSTLADWWIPDGERIPRDRAQPPR